VVFVFALEVLYFCDGALDVTWLTKDTGNGEIFPAELGFDVIRRDREGNAHGRVLIASK
jgi:hypothetical protein